MRYECPARLSPAELKAVERAALRTFAALDCRDVARVDMGMNEASEVYVLEVNPLPGLTPDYSDLVLISKAAGFDYRTLIAEILSGSLRRLRDTRRDGRALLLHPVRDGRSASDPREDRAVRKVLARLC